MPEGKCFVFRESDRFSDRFYGILPQIPALRKLMEQLIAVGNRNEATSQKGQKLVFLLMKAQQGILVLQVSVGIHSGKLRTHPDRVEQNKMFIADSDFDCLLAFTGNQLLMKRMRSQNCAYCTCRVRLNIHSPLHIDKSIKNRLNLTLYFLVSGGAGSLLLTISIVIC